MKHLAIVSIVVLAFGSSAIVACHTQPGQPTIADTAIDCAKAEATTLAAGHSVLDVARAVDTALSFFKTGGITTVETAIENLIVEYGEPIIACTIVRGLVPAPNGSAQARIVDPPDAPETIRRELAILHQWRVK